MKAVSNTELESILEDFNNDVQTSEQEERLVYYIIRELADKGIRQYTAKQINERIGELRAGYLVTNLSKKGLLNMDMGLTPDDDEVTLTDKGREYAANLLSDY